MSRLAVDPSAYSFQNPIKVLKRTAPTSLLTVAILYLLCNVAYFAASM